MQTTSVSARIRSKKTFSVEAALGIALALGGIYYSLLLQGGTATDLLQWSSLMLLLSGTCGAVLLTTPMRVLSGAVRAATRIFSTETVDANSAISAITALIKKAKRFGVVALEEDLPNIHVPSLKQAVRMAADGSTVAEITDLMRLEVRIASKRMGEEARVFETAAGYAPTLGILGAVLGLIQVMKHLDQMTAVGHGIATAFVSTVYGLALANLILLPIAGRVRASSAHWVETQELMIEGVICLMERLHPLMVESRLAPFLIHPREKAATPNVAPRELPQIALAQGA